MDSAVVVAKDRLRRFSHRISSQLHAVYDYLIVMTVVMKLFP